MIAFLGVVMLLLLLYLLGGRKSGSRASKDSNCFSMSAFTASQFIMLVMSLLSFSGEGAWINKKDGRIPCKY